MIKSVSAIHSLSLFLFIILIFFTSCGNSRSNIPVQNNPEPSSKQAPVKKSKNYYIPEPMSSFSIVLGDNIPQNFDARVIDLDAFSTTKEQIATLHEKGKKVFAYISVGSWEPYRPDSSDFPKEIIGNIYPGWEDEKFFNIKALDTLLPLMQKRFDMVKEKGFDGIEADNIDIYTADTDGADGTGFHITLADTRAYISALIKEAHDRNLSIGQKNAPELIETYGDLFDWALLEDPFFEKYASVFQTYTQNNKAVFSLSYTDNTSKETFLSQVCEEAKLLKFTAILKDRDLTAYEVKCPR